MIELDEIMRRKGDLKFTELLNRARTASQTEDDIECIQCKSVSLSQDDYPINALHIWAENNLVNEHNLNILQELSKPLFVLRSVDQYPLEVTKQDNDKFLTKGHSETGGQDFEILIKEGARVMLTTNIDITDLSMVKWGLPLEFILIKLLTNHLKSMLNLMMKELVE